MPFNFFCKFHYISPFINYYTANIGVIMETTKYFVLKNDKFFI
uniref:Uncharacterized protein n=1 Tax=Myoviridae sp. ctPuP5 TaxID=2823543 RepID=A0A8S5L9R1_9CAUD|nr:MAG TPA: hypothetical protein [Myoviridae sp. ctPuP5]